MQTFDSRKHGILALRHNDFEAQGVTLENRSSILGVEVAGRLTTGRDLGTYVFHEDPRVGDLNCAAFWPKSSRTIHGWAFAWPAMTIKGKGSGQTDTPGGNPAASDQFGIFPARHAVDTLVRGADTAAAPDVGPLSILPLTTIDTDEGFSPKKPHTLREKDENLFPKFPVGHVGLSMAGVKESEQYDLYLSCDPRLFVPHRAGDGNTGTLVCDTTSTYEVDPKSTAPLQSAFRVMQKPSTGPVPFGTRNALAWVLGPSGLKDCRGGVVWSGGIYALAGSDASGPLHVGMKEDVHKITATPEGDPVNSLHLHTGALFIDPASSSHDGPLKFESDPYPGDVGSGNKKTKVHLQWKEDETHDHVSGQKSGKWAFWAESAFETNEQPCRPPQVPTGGRGPDGHPGGGQIATPDTGFVGTGTTTSDPTVGGSPQPGQVQTLDPHPESVVLPGGGSSGGIMPEGFQPQDISIPPIDPSTWGPLGPNVDPTDYVPILGGTSVTVQEQSAAGGGGPARPTVTTDFEIASPSTAITAQPTGAGLRDALVTPDPNGDQLPTVARQTGFTRQDPNGTGGYSGTTTTPTPTFTHRPCTGYAGGGTCDGGAAMMPPEVIMLDYASTVVSTALDRPTFTSGVLVSIVYDVKAPGTNYACGIPCLATGGISSGYSWRVKNGALSFSYHDSTGAKDEAMHFTTTQRIGWRSDTDFWGDIYHANTADRQWYFPNYSAGVTLNDCVGGLGTDTLVPFFSSVGVLTQATTFKYATGTLTLGIASGTTGAVKLFAAGGTKYTTIQSGAASADMTYTLPTAGPAVNGYVLSSTTVGVMSWVAAGGVASLTGTANQVLVDGTSGVAKTGALTLTTPQDIGTASTPQFLRMGLGLAADGDSVLRVYYDYSLATSISDSSGIYVATGGPRSNSGANGYGIRCIPFVGVTAYATHPLLASVYIAGIVPDSAFATITEAASVYILNAPTCGATNWALKIAGGNAYFGGDIDASSTSAIYLGDSTTNGTWKIVRSGNDLIFQRRESGSYVTKGTFSA